MAIAPAVWAQAQTASLPNIVYILADDMGVGDVRSYTPDSPVNTPNIDRIANAGMRFTDAHSLDSVCTPSRYGILTGDYGWRTSLQNGVLNGFSAPLIGANELTVANVLKSAGYSTGMFGKWHEGVQWQLTSGSFAASDGSNVDFSKPFTGGPTDHGFDTYFGVVSSPNEGPYSYVLNNRTVGNDLVTPAIPTGQVYGNPSNPTYNHLGPISPGYNIRDLLPNVVSQADKYIGQQANQANPFFAYIPLTAPHEPIVPPTFAQGQTGLTGPNPVEPQYGDFIWSTDWAVGQILDKLADPDGNPATNDSVLNNTLVIFTADNGATKLFSFPTSPGNINGVPMRGEKQTVYEGGFRVPFVASWPGHIQAGTVNNDTIELNDLMATVASMTNTSLPSNVGEDSINILPELLGTTNGVPVRTTSVGHSFAGALTIRQNDSAGNAWKLIFTSGDGGTGVSEPSKIVDPKATLNDFTKVQLYNLTTDPGESTNLLSGGGSAAMQQKALQLQHLLQGYMYAGRSVNIPPRTSTNGTSTMLVDFGDSGVQTTAVGWNNVAGSLNTRPNVGIGLYDQGGGYMGIVLKTSWNLGASGGGGVASYAANSYHGPYPAQLAGYPDSALSDAWYANGTTVCTISLQNLDAHATYDFQFYGAASTGPQYSLYTVTGSTTQQTHISPIINNSTQVATVSGIMADALGDITINFEGRNADGTIGAGGFLNFMKITEHLLPVPGDFNGDRYVDAADYTTWQSEYGQTGSGLSADANGDGVVDMQDFVIWRKAMLAIPPVQGLGVGLSVPPTVPEPGTCFLAMTGLLGLYGLSARRRRVC